jgi:hypothetical protein
MIQKGTLDKDKGMAILKKMNSSGELEMQAAKIRQNIRDDNDSLFNRIESRRAQQQERQSQQMAEEREKALSQFEEQLKGKDSFLSFPMGKADKENFQSYLREQVTPGDDGSAPFFAELQSDDQLVELIYLKHLLKTGGLQSKLSSMKEDLKETIISKTGLKPITVRKSGKKRGGNSNVTNSNSLDRLSRPDNS